MKTSRFGPRAVMASSARRRSFTCENERGEKKIMKPISFWLTVTDRAQCPTEAGLTEAESTAKRFAEPEVQTEGPQR